MNQCFSGKLQEPAPRQREERLGRFAVQHQRSDHFSDGGTVLEAVAGAAANQPHRLRCGMAVHDEVSVGTVLVLADA